MKLSSLFRNRLSLCPQFLSVGECEAFIFHVHVVVNLLNIYVL